jgi:hypothetical protein
VQDGWRELHASSRRSRDGEQLESSGLWWADDNDKDYDDSFHLKLPRLVKNFETQSLDKRSVIMNRHGRNLNKSSVII